MRAEVYRQVQQEQHSWMKQGRRQLLAQLLDEHGPAARPAELLDVGAGLGQNVDTLRRFGAVDAVEGHPVALEQLDGHPGLRTLYRESVPFALDRRYDIIVALELLEHLPDDRAALAWMGEHLRPGGVLVLTVPACPALFSEHDEALGHHRRYSRASLLGVVPPDLGVVSCSHYNMLLFPAQIAQVAVGRLSGRLTRSARRGQPPRKLAVPHEGPLDQLLGRVLRTELALLRRGFLPPTGGGLFCVLRKAPQSP